MAWVYLIFAGVCEIGWAIGLKYTDGFKRLWPSVWTVSIMLLSFWLLAQAMRTLPVGTAYAIWTGIGAVGTAILGIVLFHESRDVMRVLCIGVIVAGIVGLKFFSPAAEPASMRHGPAWWWRRTRCRSTFRRCENCCRPK
jgi:quaternary ammonium compound-resistance protein SugE